MRLFKATYKDREGATRTAAKWYVDLRDHLGRRRRLAAFADKKASSEFGGKSEELVACRMAGERPQGDLARWLECLPPSTCGKLVGIGVLDGQRVAAGVCLNEHLADFRKALMAKGTSE